MSRNFYLKSNSFNIDNCKEKKYSEFKNEYRYELSCLFKKINKEMKNYYGEKKFDFHISFDSDDYIFNFSGLKPELWLKRVYVNKDLLLLKEYLEFHKCKVILSSVKKKYFFLFNKKIGIKFSVIVTKKNIN